MNVPVNKIPASTACFEKELNVCGYASLEFLFNAVILKSAQNVSLQRVWDFIAQKCKLLFSDAVLLSFFVAHGILQVFVCFHGIVEFE